MSKPLQKPGQMASLALPLYVDIVTPSRPPDESWKDWMRNFHGHLLIPVLLCQRSSLGRIWWKARKAGARSLI